jgi:hypothetical protein
MGNIYLPVPTLPHKEKNNDLLCRDASVLFVDGLFAEHAVDLLD